MIESWDRDFLDRSPMFEPLRAVGATFRCTHWPTLGDLGQLLEMRETPIRTRSGATLRFVRQEPKSAVFENKYEVRIYSKGEVQVRTGSWHDVFNALAWLAFPNSKAALNERHYYALVEQRSTGAPNRAPVQDAMTLFDEGGVIVAASDPELLRCLREFKWKDLFWHNRARIPSEMRFYLFGHALYEKALRPFTGITARGILFEVASEFFQSTLAVQVEKLDAMVAERLHDAKAFQSTRELAPVPILGVPGWSRDNERESYYDNLDYFRPGRRCQA